MTVRSTPSPAARLALVLSAAAALAACSPGAPEQGTGSPGTPGTGTGTGGSSGSTDAMPASGGGVATAPTSAGTAVTPGTSTTPNASGSGTDANTGGLTSASGGTQAGGGAAGTSAASPATSGTTTAGGAGTSGSGTSNASRSPGTEATTGKTSARNGGGTALSTGDRTFVVNAAAAGMTEVRAGNMAADKAADASVKAYGKMLAEQHQQSGEELARFAKLHNVPMPDQLPAARRQLMSQLDKASGGDFDRLFIEQVGVKSHEETIRMFESAQRDAEDAELKAWIDKTLPVLREHLAQAQKLPSGGARGTSGAKTG